MEYGKLKSAAEAIAMPEKTKRRIIRNCEAEIMNSGKETVMKHRTFRKPAAMIAVLAICISLAVAAVAAPGTVKGQFRDVKDWRGAVVGTSYEQASDEIRMSVTANGGELTVLATFADPQMAPYKYAEKLGIAEYKIVGANGKTVQKGAAEPVEAIDGHIAIPINLENLESGSYKLIVTAFVAEAKAEQPLPLHGHWEAEFTKQRKTPGSFEPGVIVYISR